MSFLLTIKILFLLTIYKINAAAVENNTLLQTKGETVEFENSYPCETKIIKIARPKGPLTPKTNYWKGRVDLKDFSDLETIQLVITVQKPAKIVVDPELGTLAGPERGKVFTVNFEGNPSEVRFRIVGINAKLFPQLVSIFLDNQNICEAAKEKATLRQGTVKPTPTTTTTSAPLTCGVRQVENNFQRIVSGFEVKRGSYPWHAAMYHKGSSSSDYKCGGTLINNQHVITAAHCLYPTGRPMAPEKVIIQLGKHNLNSVDDTMVEYQVSKVIIYPQYAHLDLKHDLAVLKLAKSVEYTDYIFPACLWPAEKKSLDHVVDKIGTVVGWGLTENDGLAEVLTAGTMPVVGLMECLESDRDFFGPVVSNFNYCAGYRNGTSVCNGDSGGGMFFLENGAWTLRGVVSFSAIREDREVCNPKKYVTFTDVAKYLDWIGKNI